ncbi:indolepyruvate oxidoreductase subunit beta family protein [Pelagerythrobacter aerophilus]|uniref:Indolepyruvate oxidoreductase subunit beta family protein n=1 Tax=Pelagerythrobacter aerophilus TaxID=2306995 RepID=A0A418ND31_9SPHN|nr:indolepyruvate oxidoreductase subunit beta family protein [Pelagerythrobacter aerophilus]RIV75691.1 indolepyruvate oxidoreductase subunit beta family protein [Pelagerythrobacter aerophilus]
MAGESLTRQRITIAILALGGEGGGVLAEWIAEVGRQQGYIAQSTSVPGVAQRTGATVYYIELYPEDHASVSGGEPILALMPVPGDVDIVIASELMEVGRAVLRGFVAEDRTTLIGSTHRVYAISEKSAMADGRASGERILDAAKRKARRFVAFDMNEIAEQHGSMISAVMFGALAGSGALSFPQAAFEQAIRAGGRAVASNLAAFEAGARALAGETGRPAEIHHLPAPTTKKGRAFLRRIHESLPEPAHAFAIHAVRRLMDYQDAAYAELYLERLTSVRELDTGEEDWRLTCETARYLALWMSYDDTIRVADLKVRASRFERVREEVRARPQDVLDVIEYMHPRLEEVCETLPAAIGRRILASGTLSSWLRPLFRKGRHVEITSIRWFVILALLSGMRRWRRTTLRYAIEQERILLWLNRIRSAARIDPATAAELVECQQLIKGYGDTFERGMSRFGLIMDVWETIKFEPDAAPTLRRLREAALADEAGTTLDGAIAELRFAS